MVLVLDFDGTVTDAEIEGAPFRAGYLEDIGLLAELDADKISTLAERFEAEIAEAPDCHGWVYSGHIVAPAAVDPYLRIMPVARKILDEVGAFLVERERTLLLDAILYKYNYQKTTSAFRVGAREFLSSFAGTHTFVVTNSHTEPVQAKIRSLAAEQELDWLVARVHGSAKKYAIDDSFEQIERELSVDGLSRPVLLRRKRYYDVLSGLLKQCGAAWSDLTVVGDIFELDLALPLVMGARVILMVNEFTPDYEKRLMSAHDRGYIATSLAEVRELIR